MFRRAGVILEASWNHSLWLQEFFLYFLKLRQGFFIMSFIETEVGGKYVGAPELERTLLIAVDDLNQLHPKEEYGHEEVLAAFAPEENDPDSFAVLDVDGLEFQSWRIRSNRRPIEGIAPSRGGIRWDGDVDREEITTLQGMMQFKAILQDLAGSGAKGGVEVVFKNGQFYHPNESEPLSEEHVQRLSMAHANAHDYHPHRDVGATDLNTQPRHMGYMIEGRKKKLGDLAYACFMGSPPEYSDWYDFRDVATGKGAAYATDEYIPWNPELREIVNEGGTLDVIVQGVGKAGGPFISYLPEGTGLRAASDAKGALRAKPGYYLDPEQVRGWARANGLSEEVKKDLPEGIDWIEKEELWDTPAHIVAPAFRENQIGEEEAQKLIDNGASVIVEIANHPVTPGALRLLQEADVDVLFGELANAGGVTGSHWEWANQLFKYGGQRVEADLASYERSWGQHFRSVTRRALRATGQFRQEVQANANGHKDLAPTVTLKRAVATMVVKTAIDERRQAGVT